MNYDRIHALKRETGRPVGTPIALAPQTDPFYILPARQRDAEWISSLWRDLQLPGPVHCRRIHYRLVSFANVLLPDGSPYENTDRISQFVNWALRDARLLGLIPADQIVDERNAPPIIHLAEPSPGAIWVSHDDFDEMPELPSLVFNAPVIPQPFHIEVWAEKSTINDILVPLAQTYGLNLLAGSGEVSATACRELVNRAIKSRRPVRILYISDFDPGGDSMPVAAARDVTDGVVGKADLVVEFVPQGMPPALVSGNHLLVREFPHQRR